MENTLKRKIIGICGFIGSGKGTVADTLVNEYGYTKLSFADTLKDGVAAVFNWDRKLLVRFFNEREMLRNLGGQVWRVKRGPDPEWANKAISDNRYDTTWMDEHPKIHESEWRWLDYSTEFDKTINNDNDLATLKSAVYTAIE